MASLVPHRTLGYPVQEHNVQLKQVKEKKKTMAKTNLKTYDVNIRVVAIIGVQVKAESFEDALVKAKELKTKDYMEIKGEYNDGSEQVVSVGQNELWDVE